MDFFNVYCWIARQYLRSIVLSPNAYSYITRLSFWPFVGNCEHLLAINYDDVFILTDDLNQMDWSRFESILGICTKDPHSNPQQ